MSLLTSFNHLQQASRREPVVPWPVRKRRLLKLNQLLLTHKDAIINAISADFGHRSAHETAFLELFTSLEAIKHALAHTRTWMHPQQQSTGIWFKPAKNEIRPQPLGVIGIIVPWNYPLLLTIGPLVGALAAGNRVMIKLSELSVSFGMLMQTLMHQVFNDDEVRVVLGDATVAHTFSALPFDHLLFTGSTAVGKHVMQAASANLTPVTLELGGKSPVLIAPDANITHAAKRILYGKLLNAGQTCIAPDYVLIEQGKEAAFISAAQQYVKQHYPELSAPKCEQQDYTSIISRRHFQRLQNLIDDAIEQGATVHPLAAPQSDNTNNVFQPVIVTNASNQCALMQEEIFGPILPVVTYTNIEDAIAFINDKPRPLALYVFSSEDATVDLVLDNTVSGGVTVNDTLLHIAQENMPFGGVGASGMGAYHGEYGFNTFSHRKSVFRQHKINAMGLFTPPYRQTFNALLKLLVR
jgi:coniferyl-aldehyde dehydrogenase